MSVLLLVASNGWALSPSGVVTRAEAESQAESEAWWSEQARLNSLAEARRNILTQEEKCKESLERRDSFLTESLANGNLVFGEWANESSEREFESLQSDYWKECETD